MSFCAKFFTKARDVTSRNITGSDTVGRGPNGDVIGVIDPLDLPTSMPPPQRGEMQDHSGCSAINASEGEYGQFTTSSGRAARTCFMTKDQTIHGFDDF